MPNIQLASKILRGIWLMDPGSAESYLPLAMNFLVGKNGIPNLSASEDGENEKKETKMFAVSPLHEMKRYNDLSEAPEGSIAIIPISGPLQKNDYCGIPGTATLTSRLKAADAHNNIKGIILFIDSPGGHVDGTENFSKAIRAAKKPVISIVDGLMASAAYWIGSSADEIYIADNTALVGSIGTMITLADFKGYYKKQGLKVHEVYATKSKDKNAIFQKVMNGDYKPIQEKLLDPTNELFLNSVTDNRAGKMKNPEEALTGEIFIADKAVSIGLADGFGGIAKAIERIDAIASKTDTDTNSNSNMKIDMSKYPAFAALLGFENAESTDSGLHLQESHLEMLETALTQGDEHSKQVGTLTTERDNLMTQLSDEQKKVETLTTEKNTLNQEITDLKANHVTPPGSAGNAGDSDKGDSEMKNFESYAHNKEALQDIENL